MSESRINLKVGTFVLIGLVLIGALLLNFSKGQGFGSGSYKVHLQAGNAGGIKNQAAVLMAGVKVGAVSSVDLAADGKSVFIVVSILNRYKIRSDAEFLIDSSGFLGDQFVAIRPTKNEGPLLKEGDFVPCAEPFNLQDTARAASGFIKRIDDTAARLNEAIARVDRLVLNEETLTNLSATIRNFRLVSENALTVVHELETIVTTNQAPIASLLTNLLAFSDNLNELTRQVGGVIATNSSTLGASLTNIESATLSLKSTLAGIDRGDGLVGGLLHDDALKARMTEVMNNLTILSSNLTRYGLLYKPPSARPRTITNNFPYQGKRVQ
jgi:phospholipid/cholesterol/gamma-HCH transport system substrate-binding protein